MDIETIREAKIGNKLSMFATLALPLFAFYMVLFGNFIDKLLSYKLYHFISGNLLIKHFIGYINLLFIIILANEEKMDDDFLHLFLSSIVIYFLIILTLTLHPLTMTIVMLMLLCIYILDTIVRIRIKVKKDTEVQHLIIIKNMLSFITIATILLGFAMNSFKKFFMS